jgi:hypothetical protein
MLPLRRAPPVTARPSFGLHILKNVGFLLASLVFLPLSTAICTFAFLKNAGRKNDGNALRGRNRMTIMVSGVRATKGLTLAREFARYVYFPLVRLSVILTHSSALAIVSLQ